MGLEVLAHFVLVRELTNVNDEKVFIGIPAYGVVPAQTGVVLTPCLRHTVGIHPETTLAALCVVVAQDSRIGGISQEEHVGILATIGSPRVQGSHQRRGVGAQGCGNLREFEFHRRCVVATGDTCFVRGRELRLGRNACKEADDCCEQIS